MLALLLLMPQAAPADLIAAHASATRAEIPCRATSNGDEIVVCALRDADRYRVPYITPTPGDPKIVDVPAERSRLIAQRNNCQQMALSIAGCGMAGVSMTAGNGAARCWRGHGRWRLDALAKSEPSCCHNIFVVTSLCAADIRMAPRQGGG